MNTLIVFLILMLTRFVVSQTDKNTHGNISDWRPLHGTIDERDFMGKKSLSLSRGLAVLENSAFTNGTIEVDIAPMNPGLSGIAFHIDENVNYNETYIRYSKSGGPDALQYSAVWNGEFSWQLYPEYQAAVRFTPNEWIHLKIVVEGYRAAVFVNADTIALKIDSLRIPNSAGKIGLWTLAPAYFANLVITPSAGNTAIHDDSFRRIVTDNPLAIHEWLVSEPFEFSVEKISEVDRTLIEKGKWIAARTEPDGLLNICRFTKKRIAGRTRENSNDVVWLRYEWTEEADGIKPFSFDYVNRCAIFLNGRKQFSGMNTFLLKGALYRGDIDKKMRGNTLHLPVVKGKNSLMIAVAHITNGWGFIGGFADAGSVN
ncbi:MAG: family 16 glycoside hydrolase [Bacteroidota bacterium]